MNLTNWMNENQVECADCLYVKSPARENPCRDCIAAFHCMESADLNFVPHPIPLGELKG
jgi:hypothetical protein